jgi:hypothetical protein
MIKTPEAISIAEICVYVPIFFLTIIILFRHGFKRQSGWIYLAIFCLIRIIGGIFKIESASHPYSITDLEWGTLLSSVGLSPLLLASFGLLKRITDLVTHTLPSDPEAGNQTQMNFAGKRGLRPGGLVGNIVAKRVNATSKRSRIIQFTQIPVVVGLALCIVGGTNTSDISKGRTFTKAGLVIFLAAYVLLAALLAVTVRDVGELPRGENRLYWVLVAALPFLGVRLLYSLIALFGHDSRFAIAGGDPWIQFGMAVVRINCTLL